MVVWNFMLTEKPQFFEIELLFIYLFIYHENANNHLQCPQKTN